MKKIPEYKEHKEVIERTMKRTIKRYPRHYSLKMRINEEEYNLLKKLSQALDMPMARTARTCCILMAGMISTEADNSKSEMKETIKKVITIAKSKRT